MRVPDAAAIVGQLADDDRRRVLAALILDAQSLDAVVERTGLSPTAVGKALGRLVDAGMVVQGAGGGLHLLTVVFRDAARSALSEYWYFDNDTQVLLRAFSGELIFSHSLESGDILRPDDNQ